MTKAERFKKIIDALDNCYPHAACSLEFIDAWHLLVSAILATQCTDKRVNMVTPALFDRYKDVYDFAQADKDELIGYIRSTGFYNNKAKNIILAAKKIRDDFGGKVPDTIEDLVKLDGVGRKIANLIIGDVYNKSAVVIDTHAKRVFYRMGLTKNTNPDKIEKDIRKIAEPERSTRLCHQIVEHGRAVCTARKPKCDICCVNEWCKKVY